MLIREIQFDDYAIVQQVRRCNGLSEQSPELWEHLLLHNPFLLKGQSLPHGWLLLDNEDKPVGVYGNYPFGYQWNGQSLLAGISHSWAVNPECRRYSLLLFQQYQRQKNVHFLLNTSANFEAARIQEVMKTRPVPVPYYAHVLFWILDYPKFVAGAMGYKNIPARELLKYPLATGLWVWDHLRQYSVGAKCSRTIQRLDCFDDRFDNFWEQLRHRANVLLGVRSREVLEWHFRFHSEEGVLGIFVAEGRKGMEGYVIVLRQDLPETGWRRYRIVDLQTVSFDPACLEALVGAAIGFAKENNAHLLEIAGLDYHKRQHLETLRPHKRRMRLWPAWYTAVQPVPGLDFENSQCWDFSLYDGDSTMWPKPCLPNDNQLTAEGR